MTHSRLPYVATCACLWLLSSCLRHCQAQYTPFFFDGFDVSANSSDINFEISATRQGGAPAPVSYVTSTADASDDFRHQLFGPGGASQPLQLAEDGGNLPGGAPPIFSFKSMVSPDFNFNGTLPNGEVVGKRITFELDVAAFLAAGEGRPTFTQAGITIGGERPLIDNEDEIAIQNGDPASTYFSATFIEDLFAGIGEHVGVADSGGPVFDNTGCIGCSLTHTAGFGQLNVQIDIDDPADGNPWDGAGSTVIQVFVNGDPIRNPNDGTPYVFEKADGGYTDNYITLFGHRQTFTSLEGLATHTFDNLTIWSAPLFPVDIDADFDDDGDVDGRDFLVWQGGNGATGQTDKSAGDSNGDGNVDAADLANWASAYGTAGPTNASLAGVPEPSSICVLLPFGLGILGRMVRQRKRT
ncbi:MAG: hypothetical protein CMJ58_07840 [Planctomycetaceae bacterium]|nr:hypothetical protein [Planctomycetaceae bacterium]